MKIHLIAIGGSIMHNLAIALQNKGYAVSGSDDHIYEPALGRLKAHQLLPEKSGWDAGRIQPDMDIVILGMHAKADNPELQAAQDMGLKIMSFPEFIYSQSQSKTRVVIAGSHGKTSVTAMIMHVLKKTGMDFDYAVGSSIAGFENSVRLSDAPLIIIEGDEYLSSPIDRQPKFMWYHPQIALINGIAWDHINVFPTYEIYKEQFSNFIHSMEPGASLIYHAEDAETKQLVENSGSHLNRIAATIPAHEITNGNTYIRLGDKRYSLSVFGRHNLQNLAGAQKICALLGIDATDFWQAAADFTGAGKRLEKIENDKGIIAFRDFAHAPSKVKATVEAVHEQFSGRQLVAILELHTFSSLNKNFISQYAGTLDRADFAIVYVDNEALKAKGGDIYTEEQIKLAFHRKDLLFFDNSQRLLEAIEPRINPKNVLLFMSSGNFGGIDVGKVIKG